LRKLGRAQAVRGEKRKDEKTYLPVQNTLCGYHNEAVAVRRQRILNKAKDSAL
jgi:hypothetical protein